VDGHRAPVANLLNQISLSADCCRAMHFVTICDSDDSGCSDSDMPSENGSLSDECVDTATADNASLPAVGIATAASIPAAASALVRDLSSATVKERCRVQGSPVLHDTINSLPLTASARSGHGSTIQTPTSAGHCQHICKLCHCCCHKSVKDILYLKLSRSVCLFFVPCNQPQFSADLDQIWHVRPSKTNPGPLAGSRRQALLTPLEAWPVIVKSAGCYGSSPVKWSSE